MIYIISDDDTTIIGSCPCLLSSNATLYSLFDKPPSNEFGSVTNSLVKKAMRIYFVINFFSPFHPHLLNWFCEYLYS